MTDYTDLKANLLKASRNTNSGSALWRKLVADALAAIEELEQRSASADEAMYRAAGLTRRETLPPIEEVLTGIESAIYCLLERTLRAEQRSAAPAPEPVAWLVKNADGARSYFENEEEARAYAEWGAVRAPVHRLYAATVEK